MSNPYGEEPKGDSFEDKAKQVYGEAIGNLGGTETGNLDVPVRGIKPLPAVLRAVKNYVKFTGRASRSEYWWYTLAYFIVSEVLNLIDGRSNALSSIFGLALLLPSLGLGVRRLHDIGRSGWWLLLALIPIVGWIILIVWAATPPKPAGDKYGPSGITA